MFDVKVMGIKIGRAMRRGDVSCDNTVFYGFMPVTETGLVYMEDATFDFINGTLEHWKDNHTLVNSYDLVEILEKLIP